jgi:hypothetical protein
MREDDCDVKKVGEEPNFRRLHIDLVGKDRGKSK